jgi:hypothetical protein
MAGSAAVMWFRQPDGSIADNDVGVLPCTLERATARADAERLGSRLCGANRLIRVPAARATELERWAVEGSDAG